MQLKFKKLNPNAKLPVYGRETDAGFDLYSIEDYTLKPNERKVFQIGISSEIPEGYFVMVKPRSGLAVKSGIDVLAGIIDCGYRNEWGVVLINLGSEPYEFKKGDKIAQGILLPCPRAEMVEVQELSEAERGLGGFGSSGR